MKQFCVTTLTHNADDRKRLLRNTVKYFTEHTNYENLDWFVLINGSDESWKTFTNELQEKYSDINWVFDHSDVNWGVGAGINRLNKMTEDYEYQLFLEGDWYCVPENLSFLDPNWMNTCIDYLHNHKEISQIVLRKYLDDTDDRMYGYGYWIQPSNLEGSDTHNGIEFLRLKDREYTNNPHIRRTKDYFDIDIFPLDEFYDEQGNPTETLKENADWGQAEIKAEFKGFKMKSVYPKFGKFIHGDGYPMHFDLNKLEPTGCGNCKYGLMTPTMWWCLSCLDDNDFTQFCEHQQYYERNLGSARHPDEGGSTEKGMKVGRLYHTGESEWVSKERPNKYKLTLEELADEERFKADRRI